MSFVRQLCDNVTGRQRKGVGFCLSETVVLCKPQLHQTQGNGGGQAFRMNLTTLNTRPPERNYPPSKHRSHQASSSHRFYLNLVKHIMDKVTNRSKRKNLVEQSRIITSLNFIIRAEDQPRPPLCVPLPTPFAIVEIHFQFYQRRLSLKVDKPFHVSFNQFP